MDVEKLAAEQFQEGIRAGELRLPCCMSCHRYHWYPLVCCPHCRGGRIEWNEVDGEATVFTVTTVRHTFDPIGGPQVPYLVALVELVHAPGIRLVTNLVDVGTGHVRIGMTVDPVFVRDGEPPLLMFRLRSPVAPKPPSADQQSRL